jgi:TRAP-type C4-dicarboxylate transport system substrate-binding protein
MTSKQSMHGTGGHRFTRRSGLKGTLALAGMFAIVGRASAAAAMMRFGSDSPLGAPHSKSALVTIFPDAQLGANGPMTNSIKSGSLDALVTDLGHLSAAVPQADVFNLPFLFRDLEQTLKFCNGSVGEELKPKINEAFACEVLGFTIDGSSDMWSAKRPIRTPADVVGHKMGVGTSKLQRDTIWHWEEFRPLWRSTPGTPRCRAVSLTAPPILLPTLWS